MTQLSGQGNDTLGIHGVLPKIPFDASRTNHRPAYRIGIHIY
jgi:hypothetical protein